MTETPAGGRTDGRRDGIKLCRLSTVHVDTLDANKILNSRKDARARLIIIRFTWAPAKS